MCGMDMQICINGETRAFAAPMTVAELMVHLGVESRKVAIERNREIVPRSAHGNTQLRDGDRVEIVEFIGGG